MLLVLPTATLGETTIVGVAAAIAVDSTVVTNATNNWGNYWIPEHFYQTVVASAFMVTGGGALPSFARIITEQYMS